MVGAEGIEPSIHHWPAILSRVRIPDSGTPPDCDILPHHSEGM